jgi:DeoR family transcriptional regulator, aga operon transcriptional repressor
MRTADRRRLLFEQVRANGYADAAALSQHFGVDGSTIRRDLARLERAGLIRRTRGGALPNDPSEVVDIPYEMRRVDREVAKRVIAGAAAQLVKDGDTVILDAGSTTHQVAIELRHRRDLTIITNDLLIGMVVARQPANRLHLTGGFVLASHYTLVGPQAIGAFVGIHADWLFIGAEGIHPEAGITSINVFEIPTKHAMMAAAGAVVFVADRAAYGPRLRCVPIA